jgi:hypothetical protein
MNSKDLEKYRNFKDEIADKLVKDLYASIDPKEIGVLFKTLMHDLGEIKYESLPPLFKDYFLNNQNFPNWIDKEKIKVAEKLFLSIGPEYGTCLICRSLPVGYVSANVVKLLTTTGYLSSNVKTGTAKRLLETSQFILNVMKKDTFRKNTIGVKHILKVRFIHAMVRYHLSKNSWDAKKYGEPINQEDMSLTILTFSIGAILGLDKLNIKLSLYEKDAMVHYWAVVGDLIGMNPELNPQNFNKGKNLYDSILSRQAKPSEDGVVLTRALSDFLKGTFLTNLDSSVFKSELFSSLNLKFKKNVVFKIMPEMTDYIIRFLIDDDKYSDMLSLAKPDRLHRKLILFVSFKGITSLNSWRGYYLPDKIVQPFNKLFMNSMLNYFDAEFKMKLSIPREFSSAWGLSLKKFN